MKEITQVRQGDIHLRKASAPSRAVKVARQSRRVVVAEGELTGHHHSIADAGVEQLTLPGKTDDDAAFLRVLAEAGVSLTHQEHGAITLPKGDWEVVRQREYTPEEIRRVAD